MAPVERLSLLHQPGSSGVWGTKALFRVPPSYVREASNIAGDSAWPPVQMGSPVVSNKG